MITDLIKDDKQRSKKRKRSVQPEQTSGVNDKLKRKKRKSRKCDSHPTDTSKSKKLFYSKHRFLFTEQGKLGFHVGSICSEDDTYMPLLNRVEPSSLAKNAEYGRKMKLYTRHCQARNCINRFHVWARRADHLCWRFFVCTTFQTLMMRNKINH